MTKKRNRTFSNKNELTPEEEELLFGEFLELNPCKGNKYEDWFTGEYQSLKIKLYSWFTIDGKDRFVSVKFLQFELNKLCKIKINIQIYYDIIVLGLTDISQRPRCPICGNYCRFEGFGKRRYLVTCSDRCSKDLRNKTIQRVGKSLLGIPKDPESVKKQVEAHRGWVPSESYRKAASRRMKEFYKTEKGKVHKHNISELTRERNISTMRDNTYYKNRKGKYVSGVYRSEVWDREFNYDSSWELNFIKFFEKQSLVEEIEIFDRCMDAIGYYQTDGSFHKYLPDFFIKFKSGIKIVIELKPASIVRDDSVTLSKRIAAKKYFRRKGVKYAILTENELYSTKHSKYTKLCDSIGLKNSFNIFDYLI